MLNNSALDTWDPQPGMILLEVGLLDLNYPSSHVSSSFSHPSVYSSLSLLACLCPSVGLYHFNDNVSFFGWITGHTFLGWGCFESFRNFVKFMGLGALLGSTRLGQLLNALPQREPMEEAYKQIMVKFIDTRPIRRAAEYRTRSKQFVRVNISLINSPSIACIICISLLTSN